MHDVSLTARRVRRSSGRARAADERSLALAYQRDAGSRPQVVAALAPLARSIASRYHYAREPREDLEQVAMMGLVKALRGYDGDRSPSFAAYAYPTIAGELRRHFRDTGWAAHVPRGMKQIALAVRDLERETPADAGDDRIAETLGVSVRQVADSRRARRAMLAESLSAPPDGDEEAPAHQVPGAPDPGYVRVEQRMLVDGLLDRLPGDDRELLERYFRQGMSQRRIGQLEGVSQMQVSRRVRRALERLASDEAAMEALP